MSTSGTIKQAAESARNKTSEAFDSTRKLAEKAAADPIAAKKDFLHTPFMRGALPFINGGLAGW